MNKTFEKEFFDTFSCLASQAHDPGQSASSKPL